MPNEDELHSIDSGGAGQSDLRFDAAHEQRASVPHTGLDRPVLQLAESAPARAAATTGMVVEHSVELLRSHAAELADRLQRDREDLDRRKGQIAAQEAD